MLKKKHAAPKDTPHKEEDFELKLSYWHEEVIEVHLDMLKPYPGHPFKPYALEALEALAESIRQNGLQQPVIARDLDEQWEYTILSGHNRVEAMRLLGKDHVPAIIRTMDDTAAALTVVQTNLEQRQTLLPSERAYAYLIRQQALTNLKDKNVDSACDTNDSGVSGQFVREENERQVFRYIRLTHLIPELLEQVDLGKIPVNAGVDISYLDEPAQQEVWRFFFEGNTPSKLSLKAAARIREEYAKGVAISVESIEAILSKPKKPGPKPCTIGSKLLKRYAIPEGLDLVEVICGFLEERFGMR